MDCYMQLEERLKQALRFTESLAEVCQNDQLELRCGDSPSNDIGSQFWCLVGARESYASAIRKGEWVGFNCSLRSEDTREVSKITSALSAARTDVIDAIAEAGLLEPIVFDLLEHEVQHQGQLIRYFYANSIRFPDSFAKRFALDQPA